MKVKTALAQSKSHAKFLAIILVIVAAVVAFLPGHGGLGGLLCVGLVVLAIAMEIINILYITRKSRTNPDCLEEKIQ